MLSNVMHKVQQVFHHENVQQVSSWNDDFSKASEIDALIEAKEKLVEIDTLLKKDFNKKVKGVLRLDEAAYIKVQQVTHQYLTALSNNHTLKQSIEVVMYEYLRRLYATYTLILDEAFNDSKIELDVDVVNLILARYVNALFLMAKWRYFDDQSAPVGVWSNVHKVIRLAESMSILNKSMFLYEKQKKETSLAAILERGFLLDTLQKGSYSQLQIELTDRVLKMWSSNPVISKDYEHNAYQFFIHLDKDERPQRLRGIKHHADFRYWKTVRITGLIENYLCAVETRRPLDAFQLKALASTEDMVQLFKKLRVDWCVTGYKRQRREEKRKLSFHMLDVSHGIEGICLRIARSQGQSFTSLHNASNDVTAFALEDQYAIQDIALESSQTKLNVNGREVWQMIEESKTGFSVKLGKDVAPWVKSGALIAYDVEGMNRIAIAEIKTVRKKADGSHRLGLLKLSSSPIALSASLREKRNVFNPVEGYEVNDGDDGFVFSADFLSLYIHDEAGDKPKLIVPKGKYKRAHRYKINMTDGEQRMALAGEVMSKHHGWVCFELIV